MTNTIDKQLFLDALTCPTMAWYNSRALKQPPDPATEWLFYAGNEVQAAARAQLGPGLMLPRTTAATAAERTERELANPAHSLVFEASFRWDAFVARADALCRHGDGWDLIEIKGSKVPDEGKKPDKKHIDDIAYTLMVCRAAGLQVQRAVLMLINREYRLGSDLPVMVEADVSDLATARANEFLADAAGIAAAVLGEQRPEPVAKLACRNCDYFGAECLGQQIEHSVFQIPWLTQKTFATFEPELDLLRIPADTPLTPRQRPAFEAIRSGKPIVNPEGLVALDAVTWPAHYLDFETVSPALPWFTADGAYETIPFQYSLHVADDPDSIRSHHEYLAPIDADWRLELLEHMLQSLGTAGSVVVYTDYEEKRLKELALRHPQYAGDINAVIARLFDLEEVVRLGYTHPGFGGRTSIKKVLPVMVPDLSYADMAIGDGSQASAVFGLTRVGKFERSGWERQRAALLEYCRLDTMAMVRVHAELLKVRESLIVDR